MSVSRLPQWQGCPEEDSPALVSDYFGWGAPTGQTFAQEPQSMQAPSSITYFVSPAEMQLTGHSGSQAPQLMQSSLITYAMIFYPPHFTVTMMLIDSTQHGT